MSRTFERGQMIRCCEFDPKGRMLGEALVKLVIVNFANAGFLSFN